MKRIKTGKKKKECMMTQPLEFNGLPEDLMEGMQPKYMTRPAPAGIRTRYHHKLVTIKCKDCGAPREVFAQNGGETKRCLTCQWKFRNSLSRHLRNSTGAIAHKPSAQPGHDKLYTKHQIKGIRKEEIDFVRNRKKPIVRTNDKKLTGYERSNWRRQLPEGADDLAQREVYKPKKIHHDVAPTKKIYL